MWTIVSPSASLNLIMRLVSVASGWLLGYLVPVAQRLGAYEHQIESALFDSLLQVLLQLLHDLSVYAAVMNI